MKWVFAVLLCGSQVAAETCPANPDHDEELSRILGELRVSRGTIEAGLLSDQLWQLWTDAPDQRAQDLLDEGMQRRSRFDLAGAARVLDELVSYCPDYAEGYNQRAFANYLRRDFVSALEDLDRTLEIIPDHIGALSGKSLTLMGLGRTDEAQESLRQALDLNPWLPERTLLTEPMGIDI